MSTSNWLLTSNRFVAFFDILGFKDLVLRSTHASTLEKLTSLKNKVNLLINSPSAKVLKDNNVDSDQTRSITFSDSFIFFSKGGTYQDALKILTDSHSIVKFALENKLAIKGAISYGEITVDFEESLFFGQPIIDAYLLHEELQMLTAIMDEKSEVTLNLVKQNDKANELLTYYKANLKCGKINHQIMKPPLYDLEKRIETVKKLYSTTSGRSRIYIDNTLDFLGSLK